MSSRTQSILTVTDLDLMPDDGNSYEIIEGDLFVSRAHGLSHQLTISNIIAIVKSYLDLNPVGIIVPGPGVIFSDFSGVVPDLVFISNERRRHIASGDKITGAPDLVIEILSPGVENERRDRVVKRHLYGQYGVQEYWIVDPINRSIEIYKLEGQILTLTATRGSGDELNSLVLSEFRCPVERIFSI